MPGFCGVELAVIESLAIQRRGTMMESVEFKVDGLHCEGCVKSVTRMLTGVAGVARVDVSLEQGKANVEYDPARAGVVEFKRAVERAGFKAP